jgi:hypothetical protein
MLFAVISPFSSLKKLKSLKEIVVFQGKLTTIHSFRSSETQNLPHQIRMCGKGIDSDPDG